MNNALKESNFIIYESEDGCVSVDVILKDETIWLTQKGMSELFDKDVKTINIVCKMVSIVLDTQTGPNDCYCNKFYHWPLLVYKPIPTLVPPVLLNSVRKHHSFFSR